MARSFRHCRECAVPKCLRIGVPAETLDAFQLEWYTVLLCALHPLPLVWQVLKKIRRDWAQVILVAPESVVPGTSRHEHVPPD